MTLVGLVNAAHAYLCEGLDDEGVLRMDRLLMGERAAPVSPAEALRATRQAPAQGAPEDARRSGPPPMPEGYQLAPPGVIVREPEPTRGLDVLHRALGVQHGK